MIWILFCYFSNIALLDSQLSNRKLSNNVKKPILDTFTNLWIFFSSVPVLITIINSPFEKINYSYYPQYFLALGAIYQMINFGNITEKFPHLIAAILFMTFASMSPSFCYIICFFCSVGFGFPALFENIIIALSELKYIGKLRAQNISQFIHVYIRIPFIVVYLCISYINLILKCGP